MRAAAEGVTTTTGFGLLPSELLQERSHTSPFAVVGTSLLDAPSGGEHL